MYSKEIIHAIGINHTYEYCIVNDALNVLEYSDMLLKYCAFTLSTSKEIELFDIVPEFIGMEDDLVSMLEGKSEELSIPLVFKEPDFYINIHVHKAQESQSLIVLFEDITATTKAQQYSAQVHNENLLLMKDIAQKNKQLHYFNEEMQRLVTQEVSKNLEKQHMLELQTRHAQMGEMIALITHQWKQPLSVIQTLGTLLKMKYKMRTLTPELTVEKIENILNQADYISQTVHDFQKFFTPSKERNVFYLKQTIQSVLDLVQMEYSLSNIDITLEGDDEVSVKGYPNEYNQVILSLLHNAKDAFEGQDIPRKYVHITVTKEKGYSLVSIRDNAGGVPQTLLDDIFTQYTTSKKNGSGLGLYIAKSVIENNMQGKIWVENMKDGAAFFIKL